MQTYCANSFGFERIVWGTECLTFGLELSIFGTFLGMFAAWLLRLLQCFFLGIRSHTNIVVAHVLQC
jgi:hypothetical protein